MSVILECIGCREQRVFLVPDPYPVCPACQEWEEEKFKKEHEETFTIRRNERGVVHDGRRTPGVITTIVQNIIGKAEYKKETIPADIRWAVWERDNFTCRHCGARRNLTVDHIFPESKGGKATIDNCQTLCKTCNSRKGAR